MSKLMVPLMAILLLTFLNQGLVFLASADEYQPVNLIEYRHVDVKEARQFQHCDKCQCCAVGNSTDCPMMSCCFVIDCNLPGKPFGTCAFVPKTCNCNACG
ncbi:hypothetical protein ZIOFF_070683 [Zingiber officinale]|uniref:DUF7866 domain-containing protein n=1 Tax=Zingiber officinale TaxID=94328 RepID=A0A8J5C8N5_ZINOF|nr:hypothetical protein ZIOFF_070683 [Zingiber officinale]